LTGEGEPDESGAKRTTAQASQAFANLRAALPAQPALLPALNSRLALAFSARTVVMDKGRIVYDGKSAALSADPERLAQLIGVAQ
jgi:ABC-type branched-subunit amino acid transport system ATPase component